MDLSILTNWLRSETFRYSEPGDTADVQSTNAVFVPPLFLIAIPFTATHKPCNHDSSGAPGFLSGSLLKHWRPTLSHGCYRSAKIHLHVTMTAIIVTSEFKYCR